MDNTGIFIICLVVVVLPFVWIGVAELLKAYVFPAKQTEAVLRKREVKTAGSGSDKKKKYVLVFDADGRKMKFYVTREQFSVSRENTRGILTAKGKRFISFR